MKIIFFFTKWSSGIMETGYSQESRVVRWDHYYYYYYNIAIIDLGWQMERRRKRRLVFMYNVYRA